MVEKTLKAQCTWVHESITDMKIAEACSSLKQTGDGIPLA